MSTDLILLFTTIILPFISLAFSVILILIAVILSKSLKLTLEREILIGSLQATGQLLLIGFIILLFIQLQSAIYITILLAIMLFTAAYIIYRKYKYIEGAFLYSLLSLSVSTSITFLILLITQIVNWWDLFALIAFGGILVGNSMKIGSVAFESFLKQVKDQKNEIEVKLSLGASDREALKRSSKDSIYLALLPTLNSLKAIGIVWIPGGMVGMLLGGISPVEAAIYQAIIMFAITCTGIISSILLTTFLSKKVINKQLQVVEAVIKKVS